MRKTFLITLLFIFLVSIKNFYAQDTIVEPIDETKLAQLINERNGNALFINLWATWCIPCREEFPDLVKLADNFKNDSIEFYGISIDYPDEIETKIIPFVKSLNVNFPTFLNGFKKDELLINMLDENWNGALPATFIYDKEGNKVLFLEGKQSYEKFEEAVKKVL